MKAQRNDNTISLH